MKLFSVGSTEVSCSPLLVLLFAVACVCGNGEFFALYMAAVALHEAAHWVMAHFSGCRMTALRLMPYGCSANISGLMDSFDELLIALAGPVCSLVIFMGCRLVNNGTAVEFAEANAYIAAINLLPAYPLDGGRALNALLKMRGRKLAKRRQSAISAVTGAVILMVGAYTWNITLIVFGIFIVQAALLLKKTAMPPVVDHLVRTKKLNQLGSLEAEHIAVSANLTLWQALDRCCGEKFTVLMVIDDKSNWLCSLSCNRVVELCTIYSGDKRIKDIVSLTPTSIGDKIIIGKND